MNIVWTNHLAERLLQRGISRNEAFDTIKYPEKSFKISGNKWKFFKTYQTKQVVIVAVYEKNQWIILTSWTKPVGQYRNQYKTDEVFISRLVRTLLVNLVSTVKKWLS